MGRASPILKADTLIQSISVAMLLAIVARLVGFGRGILFARTLDPAELGTWALLINAVQVLAFFLVLGIPSGLSRYVGRYRKEGNLQAFLLQATGRALGIALIAVLGGIFFSRPLGRLLYGDAASNTLVTLTVAAVLATVVFSLLQGILHGLRLFRIDSWIELIHNVGFFGLACVLLLVWRRDTQANVWAYLGMTTLVSVALGFFLWRALRAAQPSGSDRLVSSVPSGAWSVLVFYSLGTWGAGTLQAVWRCLDRYMLLHFDTMGTTETLEQIGGYYIATKLGQPLSALAGLIGVILVPHAARLWEERKEAEVGQLVRFATKSIALLLTFIGAGIVMLKPYVLWILIGRIPASASIVVAPVMVTIIAVSLHYIVRCYLLCRERVWVIAGVWLVALVGNVLLNLYLIPIFHLYGAAMATLATAVVATFATLCLAARDGLELDVGTWALSALPLTLLLPPLVMLSVLALAVVLVVSTNLILTAEEKDQLNFWFAERFPRFAKRKPASI